MRTTIVTWKTFGYKNTPTAPDVPHEINHAGEVMDFKLDQYSRLFVVVKENNKFVLVLANLLTVL